MYHCDRSVADIAWVQSIFNRHHVSKSTDVNINLVSLSLTNQREQKQPNQSNLWFWNICAVNVFHYLNHTGPRPLAQISGTGICSMVCWKGRFNRPVKRTFTVLIEDDEQRIRFLHIFVDTYIHIHTHTYRYIYTCIQMHICIDPLFAIHINHSAVQGTLSWRPRWDE